MSELTKRILFAVPAAIIFVWLAWMGGAYFFSIMALLAAGTIWEIHRLMKNAGLPGYIILSLFFASLLWTLQFLPVWMVVVGTLAAVLPAVTLLFPGKREFGKKWASTLFCAFYAPFGYLAAVHVRELGLGTEGFWLILALFFMIWGNDVFAYFGGKSFGKRKLASNVSPNKTWEGFGFGILGALTGALIAWGVADDFPMTIAQIIPAAAIVSVTGPLGDLTESKLKRMANMKDSSALLPGHGGLFDRFDAMILTAPFLYFYFTMFV